MTAQVMKFEDVDMDTLCIEHFEDLRQELGFRSVWSIWDAGMVAVDAEMFTDNVRRLRYQYVREDATTAELLADMNDGGQRSMAEVTSLAVNGTVKSFWAAAESCIKQSGTHHIYIEDFQLQEDGTVMLITGS
jgi:hypothetical protein